MVIILKFLIERTYIEFGKDLSYNGYNIRQALARLVDIMR